MQFRLQQYRTVRSISTRHHQCYYVEDSPAFLHSSVAQWQSIRLLTGGL